MGPDSGMKARTAPKVVRSVLGVVSKIKPPKVAEKPPATECAAHKAAFTPMAGRVCAGCGTSTTPLWRNGPLGPKTLCNACGVRDGRRATKQGWAAQRARKKEVKGKGEAVAPERTVAKVSSSPQKFDSTASTSNQSMSADNSTPGDDEVGIFTHRTRQSIKRPHDASVDEAAPTVLKRSRSVRLLGSHSSGNLYHHSAVKPVSGGSPLKSAVDAAAEDAPVQLDWARVVSAELVYRRTTTKPGATKPGPKTFGNRPVWVVIGRGGPWGVGLHMCVVAAIPGQSPCGAPGTVDVLKCLACPRHLHLDDAEYRHASGAIVWWADGDRHNLEESEGSLESASWGLRLAVQEDYHTLKVLAHACCQANAHCGVPTSLYVEACALNPPSTSKAAHLGAAQRKSSHKRHPSNTNSSNDSNNSATYTSHRKQSGAASPGGKWLQRGHEQYKSIPCGSATDEDSDSDNGLVHSACGSAKGLGNLMAKATSSQSSMVSGCSVHTAASNRATQQVHVAVARESLVYHEAEPIVTPMQCINTADMGWGDNLDAQLAAMKTSEEEGSNLLDNLAPLWETEGPGSLLLHDLDNSLAGGSVAGGFLGCEVVPSGTKSRGLARCSMDIESDEALMLAQHVAQQWEPPRRLSELLQSGGGCRLAGVAS